MGKDEIEGQLDVCRFLLVGEVNQVCGRLQDAYFEGLPVGQCLYQLRQYALFIRAALGECQFGIDRFVRKYHQM